MVTPTDTSRRVAAAVTKALSEADITPLQAARQTGIPRSTLERRLTGNSPFTIVELEHLELLLGLTVGHFLMERAA